MAEDQSAQTTPPAPTPDHKSYPRLVRVREGRLVAGVCGGIGRYTGIDPVIVRVGFALLTLAEGQGIMIYIAAAVLMPAHADESAPVEKLLRRRFDGSTVLAGLGGLLCLGVVFTTVSRQVSDQALTVTTVFALALLIAHARKVDLIRIARTMPERLQGHPPEAYVSAASSVDLGKAPGGTGTLPPGMIDLAALGSPGGGTTTLPGTPETRRSRPPRKRPSGRLTQVTLLAALVAGAAMIPVASGHPAPQSIQILLASALAAVALGLVASGWYGRSRGLATVGTLLTVGLLTTTVAAEVPPNARYGEVEWRPVEATQSEQNYRVGAGDGRLDLTALPLSPGQRVTVNADLLLGALEISLPRSARVELDARVGLGDLTVGQRIIGGPNAKSVEILEPEAVDGKPPQQPPVIVLKVRAKLGDVTVARG